MGLNLKNGGYVYIMVINSISITYGFVTTRVAVKFGFELFMRLKNASHANTILKTMSIDSS